MSPVASKGITILVHPEKCTGCLVCQLCCSLVHHKVFNPSLARISIKFTGDEREIAFTEGCDGCSACARFCAYGTLEVKEVRN